MGRKGNESLDLLTPRSASDCGGGVTSFPELKAEDSREVPDPPSAGDKGIRSQCFWVGHASVLVGGVLSEVAYGLTPSISL